MQDSTTATKQIFTLLPKIMADIGAIPKANTNSQLKFSFRSIDQVLNSLHGPLVKYGVCLAVDVHDRATATEQHKDRVIIRTTLLLTLRFIAPDGSHVDSTAAGEGVAYSDDKSTAKAMSMALKYCCFMALCIPVDDTIPDPDRDDPGADPPRSTGRKPASRPPAAPQNTAPSADTSSARATPSQCEAIRSLTKRLKFSDKQLDAALNARHVSRIEDLAGFEAREIIANLNDRLPKK